MLLGTKLIFCYLGQRMPKCILVPIPELLIMWDVTCRLNVKGKQKNELKQFIKIRVSAIMWKWNLVLCRERLKEYNIYKDIHKEPTWCNLAVCLLVTAILLYMFRTLFASYTQYDLVWKPWTPLLDTSPHLMSYTRGCYYSF